MLIRSTTADGVFHGYCVGPLELCHCGYGLGVRSPRLPAGTRRHAAYDLEALLQVAPQFHPAWVPDDVQQLQAEWDHCNLVAAPARV